MRPESSDTPDLARLLRALWRWKLTFLLLVLLPPVAAYLYERRQPKIFASSSLVSLGATSSSSSNAVPGPNISVVARFITLPPVPQQAAKLISGRRGAIVSGGPVTPSLLASEVTASGDPATNLLTINVQDRSPVRAALIADAFAATEIATVRRQEIGGIDAQLRQLRAQQAAAPPSDVATRVTLGSQIAGLSAQRAVAGQDARILEHGAVNDSPISPRITRAVALALVIGLLLGLGVVFVLEGTRRRYDDIEELEAATGMPLLGLVPRRAFSPSNWSDPACAAAFQTLRATIAYSTPEQGARSVAILSPSSGDGKTTIAIGLARAVAGAGQRVILLDGDLHRSRLSHALAPDSSLGLTSVLSGGREVDEVLVAVEEEAWAGGRLSVLPAGPAAASSVAMVSSPQMRAVIRSCEAMADLVIVDTPAALVTGDTIPLVKSVFGALIVVRLGKTSASAITRLQKVLSTTGAELLGAVAVGGTRRDRSSYYYPAAGSRAGRKARRRGEIVLRG